MNDQKPFDLIVEDLKANLYSIVNSSGLPMSVVQLIVKDFARDVNEQHVKHIQQLNMQEDIKVQGMSNKEGSE